MAEAKRGRGRPPKKVESGTDAPSGAAHISASVSARKPAGRSCFARLSGIPGSFSLSLTDWKGNAVQPDYRAFAGKEREFFRTFSAELARSRSFVRWDATDIAGQSAAILQPSAALLTLAASIGILLNSDSDLLELVPGDFFCTVTLPDPTAPRIQISFALVDPSTGETRSPSSGTLVPLASSLLLDGRSIYSVQDLGPWSTEFRYSAETVERENLEAWLSLCRSLVPTIGIAANGWTVKQGRPVSARPALLFSEIDEYGYVHIRPMAWLEGYPPGFFEDQEIVETVRLDYESSVVRVSEILFPETPADIFRTMLSRVKGSDSSVYEEEGRFVIAGSFARAFLEEHMSDLLQNFVLLQAKVLEKYRLRIGRPKLRLSLGTGVDWFAGTGEVEFSGESLPFGVFMNQYRKNGFITLSDGSKAWPESDTVERFSRLVSKMKGAEDAISVSLFDIAALRAIDGIDAAGEGWHNTDSFLRGFNDLSQRKTDTTVPDGALRPYQAYGVQWLEYLREHGFGACLADDMGLGKTVQIIVALRNAYASGMQGNSLVLVPRSLMFNWRSEFTRFAPLIPVHVHYGIGRDSAAVKKLTNTVILSSYATIRNDIKDFSGIEFAYVVLDEAQNVKNSETRTSAAVRTLKAKHRVAMSGTPVENSLADLYSLFKFLNPSLFGSEAEFMSRYLRPIQDGQDENALKDLKLRLYPFMLRRVKKDVLADLPAKTEQTALIELSPDHLALYRQRSAELKARLAGAIDAQGIQKSSFLILQALGELRRFAGMPDSESGFSGVSAKREYIRDMVAGVIAEGHKCLIFTNFLDSVEQVSDDLAEAGIPNLVMTGATVNRQALVQQFQTDPSIGAFIMTLKTGGVGLNLTAADYVFILDPWWNRAAEDQAIDRTHRIGQTNPVFCYRMIAKDTIEEKILELQTRKAGIAEALLSSDSGAVRGLSEDDIEYLLG